MGNAARIQSGPSPVVLVAPARRELGLAAALAIGFVVALAALVTRIVGLGERPAVVDVVLCVLLVPLVVGLGCAVPLAASQVRRIRSRVVLDEEGLTLRDGRTVRWVDVARVDRDPASPRRLRLWLYERTTPPAASHSAVAQPVPIAVGLRGLAPSPDRAATMIEERWKARRRLP